jgi:hypothetical protein
MTAPTNDHEKDLVQTVLGGLTNAGTGAGTEARQR